jgi:hypothetical protein
MIPSIKIGLGGAVALCLAIGCGGSSSSEGGTGGTSGSVGTTGGSGGTTGGSGGTTGGSGGTTGGSGGTTGGSTTGGSGGTTGGSAGTSGSGGTTTAGTGGGVTIVDECPDYMPCGGDVVGSWRIRSICGETATAAPESPCADASPTEPSLMIDALYTFNADGTATFSGTANADFLLEISDACAMDQYGTDAQSLCTLLPILGAGGLGAGGTDEMPEDIPIMIDCDYADGICNCHIVEGPIPIMESSTYEISGNQITMTNTEDGTVTTGDFCVDGDDLDIREMDAEGSSMVSLTRD